MLLVLSAIVIAVSCTGLAGLGNLGQHLVLFLWCNALARVGYGLALSGGSRFAALPDLRRSFAAPRVRVGSPY